MVEKVEVDVVEKVVVVLDVVLVELEVLGAAANKADTAIEATASASLEDTAASGLAMLWLVALVVVIVNAVVVVVVVRRMPWQVLHITGHESRTMLLNGDWHSSKSKMLPQSRPSSAIPLHRCVPVVAVVEVIVVAVVVVVVIVVVVFVVVEVHVPHITGHSAATYPRSSSLSDSHRCGDRTCPPHSGCSAAP